MQPPAWVTNEDSWRKQCRRLVASAREILEGRLGIIEGARIICQFGFWLRVSNEPDFMVFRAIDSETDHLPMGEVRRHWAPDALAKKDLEISDAEAHFREQAFKAAANLIEKYDVAKTS